ncbi:sugar-binding transcriptional regulator [Shinella sp. PSBB067]|uniref:sugar-binding transcriptional regulator n=1 Tax=Shinella sp. PSBB067 TaxID=2715959 RepID=UPI00193B158A|nr:sugar-binding transcriptional regulator [Shinella sp. PSBB067]QRI63848.1 sugar-binding transcriptional regulator [Shinella sp. PSBB067]
MSDLSDDLRTRAAWLYYKEGMTQDQVAQELGLNRAKVLRMLAASRLDGTVQIRVLSKQSNCVALERELEKKYNLERAIVVPVPKQTEQLPEIIGGVLGEYVTDLLKENMIIGLGWGKTLSSCLPAIPQQTDAHISVVSLLGGLTRVSAFNPSEFAWRLGDRLAAEAYLIAAPVFAPDERTRDALLTHPGIREVFRRSENLDVAIVSVGDLSPGSTFSRYGLLERDELMSLQKAGAVGDILCRFIDADGEIIDHEVNRRVVAVDPRSLRTARKVVLASGGWHKYAAFRGALKLLSPHVVLTDIEIAQRLIDE